MRDRLIELLGDYLYSEQIADHLLANGVIVPPCKVGDTVYMPFEGKATAFLIHKISTEETVDGIMRDYDARGKDVSTCFCDYNIGKTMFLTKEEAEQALKEREQSATNTE